MFYLFSFKTCLDLKSLPILQVEDVDVAAENKVTLTVELLFITFESLSVFDCCTLSSY